MKARVFQNRLEELEHMVTDHDPFDEVQKQVAETSRAFGRLSAAFREEL